MIKAACHCTAVRFEIDKPPAWLLDCNCTICRRYGALWTYYHGAGQALLLRLPEPNLTETYLWNDHSIAFHRCRACGCVTHLEAVDVEPKVTFALNARMMLGLDPKSVRVRQIDNGHTGFFWTASADPVLPSQHPAMPPPGPDDWR